MSLYRYVGAKDELLALMVDAALGPLPAAQSRAAGARPGALGLGLSRARCAGTRGSCASRSPRRR